MIIRYDSDTGNIIGYALVGGVIPEEIPLGVSYLTWDGIVPDPIQNYQVLNNQVVLKSQDDRNTLINEQLLRALRGRRDELLASTDGLTIRHQEETLRGITTTLSSTELTALLNYKQQLRDLPATYASNPGDVVYPTFPL